MENTSTFFKKEKFTAIISIISITVLCIQHFWGIFANEEKLQLAYIPLIITFTTILVNEIDSSYENRKKIIIASGVGAGILFILGVSIWTTNGYELTIFNNVYFKRVNYFFVFIISLVLDIFQIEKAVSI